MLETESGLCPLSAQSTALSPHLLLNWDRFLRAIPRSYRRLQSVGDSGHIALTGSLKKDRPGAGKRVSLLFTLPSSLVSGQNNWLSATLFSSVSMLPSLSQLPGLKSWEGPSAISSSSTYSEVSSENKDSHA